MKTCSGFQGDKVIQTASVSWVIQKLEPPEQSKWRRKINTEVCGNGAYYVDNQPNIKIMRQNHATTTLHKIAQISHVAGKLQWRLHSASALAPWVTIPFWEVLNKLN